MPPVFTVISVSASDIPVRNATGGVMSKRTLANRAIVRY